MKKVGLRKKVSLAADSQFGRTPEPGNCHQETDAWFRSIWWDLPVS